MLTSGLSIIAVLKLKTERNVILEDYRTLSKVMEYLVLCLRQPCFSKEIDKRLTVSVRRNILSFEIY